MKKEFMRVLLDSCDKKQLVNALCEMVDNEDQLSWVMGSIPSMDDQFVSRYYARLLAIAEPGLERVLGRRKSSKDEKVEYEVIACKPFASYRLWDFPVVKYVLKCKKYVRKGALEKFNAVTNKIEEHLKNKPVDFDKLFEIADNYPYGCFYSNSAEEGLVEIDGYGIATVYLNEDDIKAVLAYATVNSKL